MKCRFNNANSNNMKIKSFVWAFTVVFGGYPLCGHAEILFPFPYSESTSLVASPAANEQPSGDLSTRFVSSSDSLSAKPHRPWFALKTNALFDLAATPNLEMEFGLSRRLSVGVEGIFPWWKWTAHNLTWQILATHVTAKYWLQQTAVAYTGWHVGLFGGYGIYDIQPFNRNGEQGHLIDAGVEAGYTWALGKHFRLETALYGGILRSVYKSYDRVLNTSEGNIKVFRYPWAEKTRDWMGPTQAKVSLVWWF